MHQQREEIVLSLKFLSIYIFLFNLFFASPIQQSRPSQQPMDRQASGMMEKSQRRVSNQLDKICSKLQISVKDVKPQDTLSKSVKVKIQKYIESDDIKSLQYFLNKKVLSYEVQIGIKSMKWNIVHFAAKNNSYQTLKVILSKTYQQSASKYKQLVNAQTSEGYTPLMISVIYSARESFLLLLELGGSDTHCVDNKHMTAYDLALNYKNQFAIRELMSYESQNNKRGDFINDQMLLKPIDPSLLSQDNCYAKMFTCFVDCFLCFKNGQNDDELFEKEPSGDLQNGFGQQQSFLKKSFNGNKLMSFLKQNNETELDVVPIGNKQIESKYSIQWKRLSTAINQKGVLFDCFQPFDISENNLIIANNLIIFQCLSDHTWLIRKIVKQMKKGESLENPSNLNDLPNQYSIELYINDEPKKITVDEYIPFLKERQEPMFLSNLNEMWPQILQKGLAKVYGSYMKLSEIKPLTFVQSLTGSYTKIFGLEDGMNYLKNEQGEFIKEKSIMGVLQDFSAKGYVILLEGRQGTTLSPKNSPSSFKNYCYTILNFYQKGNKRLILVNCPYVLNSWKQKEKTEIMQLKLIKSHYNSHNQMCVWIDQSQFAHFFKNIIISFTQPNMIRTQIKIRYLLEAEVQKNQQNKLMTVLENITNSAKSIFSSKNQKRQSADSNTSAVKSQRRSFASIQSFPVQNFKKITKQVFVKFRIENSKNSESFSLAIKDNVSHLSCKINKFKGWIDGGSKDITLQESNSYCTDLIKIKHKKGEYLCMFEVELVYLPDVKQRESIMAESFKGENQLKVKDKENLANENINKLNKGTEAQMSINNKERTSIKVQKTVKKHQLLVVCWSEDPILLEHIEEEFAVIDCLQSWRKNTIKNWSFLDKKRNSESSDQSIKYVVQKIGQKLVAMTKSSKDVELTLTLQKKLNINDLVHEGHLKGVEQVVKKLEEKKIDELVLSISLVRDSQHNEFQYAVITDHGDVVGQQEQFGFAFNVAK